MKTIIIDGVEYELHPKKKENPVPIEVTQSGHKSTCASLNKMLLSNPPQPAQCDCGYERPAVKAVDLSVLIDSGIDCSYYGVEGEGYLPLDVDADWKPKELVNCNVQPRMDYWFSALQFEEKWSIVRCLQKAGFEVEARCDDDYRGWLGFRITGLQDGYRWPWEE